MYFLLTVIFIVLLSILAVKKGAIKIEKLDGDDFISTNIKDKSILDEGMSYFYGEIYNGVRTF